MFNILINKKKVLIEDSFSNINELYENLKFTWKDEKTKLPILYMKIIHDHKTGQLYSTWYNKPSDTSLIINYHALAQKDYKLSVVFVFLPRIYRA